MDKSKIEVGRWDEGDPRRPGGGRRGKGGEPAGRGANEGRVGGSAQGEGLSGIFGTGAGPNLSSDPEMQALELLAWILDSSIQVPGTRFRVGVDALIGLIPVIGDALGALISAFILAQAARLGAPRVTLLRMGFNIGVEALVGMIPFAGDLFDAGWKANIRNVELLRAHRSDPGRARRVDRLFATGLIVCVLAVVGVCGWLGYRLLRHLLAG